MNKMTDMDKTLPLFVLLANKKELPRKKLNKKESENSILAQVKDKVGLKEEISYSLYKHISTFGTDD